MEIDQKPKTKYVYIVFSKPETIVSKLIKFATNDKYTHVGISIDNPVHDFYSFSRRYPHIPLPGGFTNETLNSRNYVKNPDVPVCIKKVEVSDEQYEIIKITIEHFKTDSDRYNYNIIGLMLCKSGITLKRERHFFCSEFVCEVLVRSNIFTNRDLPQHISPYELYTLIGDCEVLYEGSVQNALSI